MDNQNIVSTEIKGVFLLKKPVFEDERGFFHEIYRHEEILKVTGIDFRPVQCNHSRSKKGVLRGIHTAKSYSKLVYATKPAQQIVVDLRKDSPTFKKYLSFILGTDGYAAVLIPPMCGNAFQILEDDTDYFYLVTDVWSKEKEFELAWDDPEINISWQIVPPLYLSERDSKVSTLSQLLEQGVI